MYQCGVNSYYIFWIRDIVDLSLIIENFNPHCFRVLRQIKHPKYILPTAPLFNFPESIHAKINRVIRTERFFLFQSTPFTTMASQEEDMCSNSGAHLFKFLKFKLEHLENLDKSTKQFNGPCEDQHWARLRTMLRVLLLAPLFGRNNKG